MYNLVVFYIFLLILHNSNNKLLHRCIFLFEIIETSAAFNEKDLWFRFTLGGRVQKVNIETIKVKILNGIPV